jgi:hypothetical protein
MLYYPQLSSGSIAQYAIGRNNVRRTLINSLPDGTQIAMADSGASAVNWTLTYSYLTTAELSALQQLFAATLGRWQIFTFLDPTDNLLNWSEDLSQAVWQSDPLLTLTGGFADPMAGTSAWQVINTAHANQQIVQSLPIPASYQYCLSFYVRADVPCSFSVTANSTLLAATASTTWTRLVFPLASNSGTGTVVVGASLPPGCSLYLFGMQLEAQQGAGGYKTTEDIAGVYTHSRFDQDVLTTTATDVNQFGATVKIFSNVAG